jgi:hypothetical protein
MEDQDQALKEFRKKLYAERAPRGPHIPVINVSGLAYARYKKKMENNEWPAVGWKQFMRILNNLHHTALNDLCSVGNVNLPMEIGRLYTTSWQPRTYTDKEGNEKLHKTAVDYTATAKLWMSDPRAKADKVVLHFPPTKRIFKICLKMSSLQEKAPYLMFQAGREFRLAFAQRVKAGKVVTTGTMRDSNINMGADTW